MPDFDDSLGGQTLGGDNNDDRFEKSLGDEHTMGGDTDVNSLGDASTMGDANIEDDWGGDDMELVDLSARYTEEGVLGKGGMGEVLLATDTRLDRKVAIKRILGKAARSKTASQRFLTEAKSIAALNHNNIVQIYDYGRSTDGPFLIMECVQGGSLLDKCKEGPIELEEAVTIFSQLCDGLAKAHAANIIHRDIKPANVLMTEDGVPKLTDFGLAKDDTADTGMTMQGAVIGTLDFMPPEQREGAHLTDHRSDLWSLAATFYQMLTGKSPKVINITELPAKLQSVVAKSLEQSKDDRYQSALEMREAIMQAHSGKMDTSRTLGEGECPECGTLNPPNGKFCVDCSAKLQVPCLQCQHPIQIWNKACGECGAQQQSLVDAKLDELQGYHDQAEAHLQALDFDKAVVAADAVGAQDDPRLQKYSAWHEEFTQRLEQSRTTEYARLKEILEEALTHENAYDYQTGLRVLEQVAEPLLETKLDGVNSTASHLNARLQKNHGRLKELEQIVRQRVSTREISGLLPLVNEMLTLKPNRPQVEKLKNQLEKREVKRLRNEILAAVNANRLNGLLPNVEACLRLDEGQNDLIRLRQQLEEGESQTKENLANAESALIKGDTASASQLLAQIPANWQSDEVIDLHSKITNCEELHYRLSHCHNPDDFESLRQQYLQYAPQDIEIIQMKAPSLHIDIPATSPFGINAEGEEEFASQAKSEQHHDHTARENQQHTPGTAMLILKRRTLTGQLVRMKCFLDDKLIFKLPYGSTKTVKIPIGNHNLQVKGGGAFKGASVNFNASPNSVHCFKVSYSALGTIKITTSKP